MSAENFRSRTTTSCGKFLADVREYVRREAPELLSKFDLYADEAQFARTLIADDLAKLPRGAAILEVGAGSFLVSCMLAGEGFAVTALEPIGTGFSHFTQLQSIVVEFAAQHGIHPVRLGVSGEELDIIGRFEYAFSINVMEHVSDVARVLENVLASLKPGCTYRFVCPNYAFPYEPHFNLPTLLSKPLTHWVMFRSIMRSKNVFDPAGTWASLNWITVRQVRRICRQRLKTTPVFDGWIFETYLARNMSDNAFRERRGPVFNLIVKVLERARIMSAWKLIPVALLPVMDCRIARV